MAELESLNCVSFASSLNLNDQGKGLDGGWASHQCESFTIDQLLHTIEAS